MCVCVCVIATRRRHCLVVVCIIWGDETMRRENRRKKRQNGEESLGVGWTAGDEGVIRRDIVLNSDIRMAEFQVRVYIYLYTRLRVE